jgi:hypothetical protein
MHRSTSVRTPARSASPRTPEDISEDGRKQKRNEEDNKKQKKRTVKDDGTPLADIHRDRPRTEVQGAITALSLFALTARLR